MRLISLLLLSLSAFVLPAQQACGEPKSRDRKPNVVFVLFDQIRADALGTYGGGKNTSTPHIDQLASQGVVFTNAISSAPLCTPYRGMLMTGRYPTHTGLVLNWVDVNPAERSIAHAFAADGYETGFLGKWHLAAGMKKEDGKHLVNRRQGREVGVKRAAYRKRNPEPEYVPPGPARLGFEHWEAYNFHTDFNDYYFYRDTPKRINADGFESDILIDQAIAFMEKRKGAEKPFFLLVAPHPPHPPFSSEWCPKGYLEKIPNELRWSPNVPADHPFVKNTLEPRCYYSMLKNADDNVGRLLDYLDRSGLAKNTIFVLTSDHGTMLGSHGRRSKMVPYAEAINIPLIVRWPAQIEGGRRDETIYTPMDHLPTLCAMADVKLLGTVDGSDLSAAILGTGKIERDAALIMNYTSHWDYFDSGTLWPEWRGVRTGHHTYVRWLTGVEELYDNEADPYQMKNLASDAKHEKTRDRLRARLKELLADAHDDFPPGTAYADWYDDKRVLLRTALGPVRN
jgi:arylsulfatase A-like enzyme